MAYLKPSWFNRAIFNRIATTFSFGPFETMVVTKRVSKQQQKVPVTPIEVDGVKYLVSAYGETQWVQKRAGQPGHQARRRRLRGGRDCSGDEGTDTGRVPGHGRQVRRGSVPSAARR